MSIPICCGLILVQCQYKLARSPDVMSTRDSSDQPRSFSPTCHPLHPPPASDPNPSPSPLLLYLLMFNPNRPLQLDQTQSH